MLGFCVYMCTLHALATNPSQNKMKIKNSEILSEKRIADLERILYGLTERQIIPMKRFSEMESVIRRQQNDLLSLREELGEIEIENKQEKMDKTFSLTDAQADNQDESQKSTGFRNNSMVFSESVYKVHRRSLFVPMSLRATEPSFYVYMSANEVNPGMHHTLIFDHVITNVGNGYNRHTGIFFALAAGTYVFSFSISPASGANIPVEIVRNSDVIGASATYAAGGHTHIAALTVVVELSIGDVCFVRTSSTTAPAGNIRSDAYSRSSFAGWSLA